jgi:hypothetical protein
MATSTAWMRAFCAPRLAIFPEACAASSRPLFAARGWLLLAGLLLGACSRSAKAVRLPSDADAYIYRITCGESIEICREKAVELCKAGYEILESVGAPISPPRVSTAPGPRSTGSRYQHPDWAGQIVVACVQTGRARPTAAPLPAVQTPASASDERVCVPGATQECLGPAACRGAQACLLDGRGYGACDCGNAGSASVAPVAADAGAPR